MKAQQSTYWPKGLPRTLDLPRTSLYYNLEVAATRYPDKPAVVFYDSVLSYAGLCQQVQALAGYLQQECGVRPGDRVALYSQNCPQYVIGYYAILRAQGVVVPVNPMNLAEELQYCVADSGARTALVAQELYGNAQPLLASGDLDHLVVHAYADYLTEATDLAVPAAVTAPRQEHAGSGVTLWQDALDRNLTPAAFAGKHDDLCVIGYTSGTTGHPKGCVHSHSTVMASVAASAVWRGGSPAFSALAIAPLFHFLGMQGGMNGPIFNGATAVLMQRWDRDVALKLIERHRVSLWSAPPSMIVDFFSNPALADHDVSSLSKLMGGGAAMPEAISRKLAEEFSITYNEAYGLTETAAFILGNPIERGKRQCLGIASFGVDARIVDPATLEELPQGETGEIILHGPQVMLEYWNNPEATAKSFLERDGKRFLRTGDLGYMDEEGYFFMVDRLKRMINASGFKVWPAEVESIMYGHPDIHEACIIAVPDPKRGETARALVVLKPTAPANLTEDDIIAWCKQHMAAYKVPTSVAILDELPKSGTGKIMWRQLQEDARAESSNCA
ncbi:MULTISPECIES: long-chain fatty acid--CoA ligase [Marinobacter]|uniref:Long-chain fatty acid--CoA ligase n=1 Tax=Marinobacter profundi TaxID=2666256 RepID=A0A2G1UJA1_9GAMM|nr:MULTISPECIES: long-chain fatty acid--CoA ligase [Marinobacter]MBD3656969.1 long-chain fatty acid--CoA ligase [Marinobacter sp.]PHQ14535.1 long-chain fatty acid--CoA ligase [Marinobacter profundi]